MKGNEWLIFVVGAFLCWGSYGPTIHAGQKALRGSPDPSLRVFICVGGAYFLAAIILPSIVMLIKGTPFSFNAAGVKWGLFAGTLGAGGAFFVILAMSFLVGRGVSDPARYVMPLVFAGAPIVNVAITMIAHPPEKGQVSPMLYVGFLLAAAGAGMVLYFKPSN